MKRGLFVVVEGLDFSGKTTLVKYLKSHYAAQGVTEVLQVRAPGGTPVGLELRRHLVEEPLAFGDPYTRQQLFLADHNELVTTVVLPALERGALVVADRFLDSTRAYSVGGMGLDWDRMDQLIWSQVEMANPFEQRPLPDLTLYLDISVETLKRRRAAVGSRDPFDHKADSYYEAIRGVYLTLLDGADDLDREYIDAGREPEHVIARATSVVDCLLATEGYDVARCA